MTQQRGRPLLSPNPQCPACGAVTIKQALRKRSRRYKCKGAEVHWFSEKVY